MVAYITYPSMEEAQKMASHLLDKRLIACANHLKTRSMYWWKDNIEEAEEVASLVKTREELWDRLVAEVEKTHPYETPCITRINAQANQAYEDWVSAETRT